MNKGGLFSCHVPFLFLNLCVRALIDLPTLAFVCWRRSCQPNGEYLPTRAKSTVFPSPINDVNWLVNEVYLLPYNKHLGRAITHTCFYHVR